MKTKVVSITIWHKDADFFTALFQFSNESRYLMLYAKTLLMNRQKKVRIRCLLLWAKDIFGFRTGTISKILAGKICSLSGFRDPKPPTVTVVFSSGSLSSLWMHRAHDRVLQSCLDFLPPQARGCSAGHASLCSSRRFGCFTFDHFRFVGYPVGETIWYCDSGNDERRPR